MKIYKLIPSHHILTSFDKKDAEILVNLIEERQSNTMMQMDLSNANKKRLESIKRALIKIVHAKKIK